MTAMILWAKKAKQYGVRRYSMNFEKAAYLTRHRLHCFPVVTTRHRGWLFKHLQSQDIWSLCCLTFPLVHVRHALTFQLW